MTAMDTVAESLQMAVHALVDHTDSPRLDAELLLCKVLGFPRSALIVRGAALIGPENRRAYENLLAQRVRGAPIAYLTGSREFWSLNLIVTPDVLVPRPETEMLVERALELLPGDQMRSILDLGTGSGAIALAIASERPRAYITGVDVSEKALDLARANSRELGLSRVAWRLGAWFDAVPGERFDMIVANPPYVGSNDAALARLSAEPMVALTPGPTGLEALTAIVDRAASHLHPRGWLLLEHGSTQAEDVARLLESHEFAGIRSHVDYSGKPRVTMGYAPSLHEEYS